MTLDEDELGLSPTNTSSDLWGKLSVQSRTKALRHAQELGLITD